MPMPVTIDLSLSSLFQNSSGIVQVVLILLALCSVGCWAIIIEKAALLFGLHRQTRAFEQIAEDGRWLDLPAGDLAQVIVTAARRQTNSPGSTPERVERAMRDCILKQLMRGERRLSYLASIGSSAPFIGLFGTVWGIMHSFASIAASNDTSLAVVAPGIAEALSTTAIGLAAAIPASIAYNKLMADFGELSRRLALAAGQLARHSVTWKD